MPIRKVLLDAFGTVFSPRPPGVIGRYADVAASHGLVVDRDKLGRSFRVAFGHHNKSDPLYGKFSRPPLDPSNWWARVITDAFLGAGISPTEFSRYSATLVPAIQRHFSSQRAYKLHGDVLPFLSKLHAFSAASPTPLLPPGVVSGSDLSTLSVLRSLGVLPREEVRSGPGLDEGAISDVYTTWELGFEKKDERFWHAVRELVSEQALELGQREVAANEILVVGDELIADYVTPRAAGFHALLLRRPGEGDGAARSNHSTSSAEEEENAKSISDLRTITKWITWLD